MGQKVNPIGLRVGVIRDWESRWYADKDFGDLLHEDHEIREYIFKNLKDAYISRVEIERYKNRVDIIIRTARPGVVIGVNGANIEATKKALAKISKGNAIQIKVVEVANPDLDAHLVARNIAEELEKRTSFRVAQKRAIQNTMRSGAKGIKTQVSGRLGGADMARTEGYSEGVVPLHTIRSDIDYAHYEAMTQFGLLGVKVWICRGEVLPGQMVQEPEAPKNTARRGGQRRRRPNNRGQRPAESNANNGQGGN
jgi:small subunit ribosomal protein S3